MEKEKSTCQHAGRWEWSSWPSYRDRLELGEHSWTSNVMPRGSDRKDSAALSYITRHWMKKLYTWWKERQPFLSWGFLFPRVSGKGRIFGGRCPMIQTNFRELKCLCGLCTFWQAALWSGSNKCLMYHIQCKYTHLCCAQGSYGALWSLFFFVINFEKQILALDGQGRKAETSLTSQSPSCYMVDGFELLLVPVPMAHNFILEWWHSGYQTTWVTSIVEDSWLVITT